MSTTVNKSSNWNFSLEDTTDKCYRDIHNELTSNGWNRVAYKKRSKLERKRLPARDKADVIWTLNEKDIDFTELSTEQGCNHFENITSLTTKRGYCDLLREVHWNSHDSFDLAPRCYNLGDPIHRDEFIDDFRLTAAANILKWYVLHMQHNQSWCSSCTPRCASEGSSKNAANNVPPITASSSSSWRHSMRKTSTQIILPPAPFCDGTNVYTDAETLSVLQDALTACVWHVRVSKYGEWPEVDISRYFKGRETPLEEGQWAKLLDFSYDIAALRCDPQLADLHECFDISTFKRGLYEAGIVCSSSKTAVRDEVTAKIRPHFDAFLFKVKAILHCMAATLPQIRHIDGIKNIWVIKAPDSSCGVGIKLHARLDDILQSERGMGGRTVQKYLESPLLVPLTAYVPLETTNALLKQKIFTRLTPPPLPLHTSLAKFDMRVWVLVTSFQPLTAYIFSTLYGRRCSTAYDLNVDTLHDSYTHLTNYSVQKKQKLSASGSTASMRRSSTDRGGNSTDNSDQDEPDLSTTSSAASSKVDLHALSKADTSVTRRLRSAVGSARNNTSSTTGAPLQSENVPLKRLSEADLLVSHEEIVTTVQRQYLQYLHSTTALAKSVVKRIGRVDDVWGEYLWPLIRHKILCTLQGACESVVSRPRSFEFLGYDVILDASLQPWVLEVNMSPAMAHRSPQQSKLIETMTQGLLNLAVYPHFGGSAPVGTNAGDKGSTKEKGGAEGLYGQWETLTPSTVTSSGGTTTTSNVETSEVIAEPEDTPAVVLGDWDEIVPPPGTFTKPNGSSKPRRPSSGSALHRKYAHVHGNSSEAQSDAYFQKFVNAAADQSSKGNVHVNTGVDGIASGVTSSGANFVANVTNLIAVGSAVTVSTMNKIDSLCSGFGQVLHLQEWWRKRLAGVRIWHQRRHESCIKIQCAYRQHRARIKIRSLRNQRAALRMQCFVRRQLARRFVVHRRRTLSATCIQCLCRGIQGRKRFVALLRLTKQRQIQKWFWHHVERKKIRASTLIVLRVRAWLQKRKRSAILVGRALKMNFIARRRRTAKVSRIFYDWLASYKFAYNYRLENIRILAASAAEKAQTISAERRNSLDQSIQQSELLQMNEQDNFMQRLVRREEGFEVAQEMFEEVLDRAWTVVRKRRLSQQRMSRAAPHASGLHKHAAFAAVVDGAEDAGNMHLSAAARRQQAEIRAEQKSKSKHEEIGPEVHNEEFLAQQFVQKKKASSGGLRRSALEEEQQNRSQNVQPLHAIPMPVTEITKQTTSKPFQHVDNFQFDADAILQALVNTTSHSLAASFSSSTTAVGLETGDAYPHSHRSQSNHNNKHQKNLSAQKTEGLRHLHENLPDPSQLRAMINAAAAPDQALSPHTPPRSHSTRPSISSQGPPFAYYEAHTTDLHAQSATAAEEEAQWHTKEKRNSFHNGKSDRQNAEQPPPQEMSRESSHPSKRERRAPINAGNSRGASEAETAVHTLEKLEGDDVRPASGSAFLFSSALSGHSLKVRDSSTKNHPTRETNSSDEPLRRSLDTVTATQRPAKQKVLEQNQVDNKNWFSFDGGSSTRLDSNEAWFLALQRRNAEKDMQFNGTAHELPMHKTRPQSSSAIRSKSGASSQDGHRKQSFIPHAPATPLSNSAQSSPNSQSHRKFPVYTHDLLEPHVNPALTIGRAPSPPAGFYYTQHTDSSSGKVRPTSAGARYSATVMHSNTHGGMNVAGGAGHTVNASSRPARVTLNDFYAHAAQPPVDTAHFTARQVTYQTRPVHDGHNNAFHVPTMQPALDEFYSHARANVSPWDNNIYNTVAPSTSGKYQFDRTPVESFRSKKSSTASSATNKKDKKKVKERITATYMG